MHAHAQTSFESETKQVNPTSLTLLSFRSFYLSRSPRSLQLPFTLPQHGGFVESPQSPRTLRDGQRFGGQASESVPALCCPCALWGRELDTKGKPRRGEI